MYEVNDNILWLHEFFFPEPEELRKYCESLFEFRKITVNKFK